ncbi:hypothetical protein [Brevibacterium sp. 'Marine']|uniref:hypothetical protein n=1 Tax=Brevibacterium sp. 'Marine' TaxID=2725563 RepID=UPI00145DF84A|nr:hypothetical protein [Brevibacterium sp. 'Marine']
MKLTWQGTNYAQVGFHSELHEYDAAPPVSSLLMDRAPVSINPEREAIAGYLAFGRWVSGDLQLPHRLGPNTAAAIENDLDHVQVRPGPIEYYPKPLEIGLREVELNFDTKFPTVADCALTILPASEWSGSLRSLRSMAIASNAFVLDAAASSSSVSIRARLAVAVLFAGDLSADSFVISADIEEREKQKLGNLLLSVRLGVRFVERW